MKDFTKRCISWIEAYFKDANAKRAVIGVSGGKDSTVCTALLARALGPENVYGVLLPDGAQRDIEDARRVVELLKVNPIEINIKSITDAFKEDFPKASEQALTNLPPRVRMTMLYFVAQSLGEALVCNTSNLDEAFVGYSTIWGDSVGDLAPLGMLHVSEVVDIGLDLGLPEYLVKKAPDDGLTGKSDEERLGFTYKDVENVMEGQPPVNKELEKKILSMHSKNSFKSRAINLPTFLKADNSTN